jgi:hypothetical protein
MTNPYFDHRISSFRFLPLTLVRAVASNARLDEVSVGFDTVKAHMDLKAPLASPTFTGTVTFNAGTVTFNTTALNVTSGTVTIPSPGTVAENSGRAATTAWVQSLLGSLSVGLPPQLTHAGKWLQTDGISASWQPLPQRQSQVFTSSGTFTPPAGVSRFFIILIGGGGGGAFSAQGGAGGLVFGVAEIGGPVSVTIGAGGSGAPGSASSIGSIATANGGNVPASGTGAAGGTASTTAPGCVAVTGEFGQSAFNNLQTGGGGASLFGSGGPGGGGGLSLGSGKNGIAIFIW